MTDPYLIWSNEHAAWWGADRRGYFTGIASAGRYSRVEALEIARSARGGWRPGERPPEIALPERDAYRQAIGGEVEWTHADVPAVMPAGGERSCASCSSWSEWLGETGDCLFHAYQRREAIIAAQDAGEARAAKERWASRSARMTAADEVCDGWAALSLNQEKQRARRVGEAL